VSSYVGFKARQSGSREMRSEMFFNKFLGASQLVKKTLEYSNQAVENFSNLNVHIRMLVWIRRRLNCGSAPLQLPPRKQVIKAVQTMFGMSRDRAFDCEKETDQEAKSEH
jgi:hypothetical protein